MIPKQKVLCQIASVDTGSLKIGGRKQQPGSPIYNNPMTFGVAHKRLSEIA